ncbi:MAG: esterase-like activity of phytase family protein [Byssovorax sp.]
MGRADRSGITILTSHDPSLKLGDVDFPGGKTLHLSIGFGSGAFHAAGDPENILYTVSDRGPTIHCDDAEATVGVHMDQICNGDRSGKVFAVPGFVPSIYVVELGSKGRFTVLRTIPLRTRSGAPVSGLPNPLETAKTERGYDREGNALPFDVDGLDPEGIVKLADGSFWLAEEYAPSLVHVAADGRILERLVPAGLEADLAGADYEVTGSLPAILRKRAVNRGFESVAVSPDERFLYTLLQSPLGNPDKDTFKRSRQARLFEIDLATRRVVGEFVYVMDTPDSFPEDAPARQKDVKLSEMMALGTGDLVVLERIDRTTRLQRVSLAGATNILGSAWDDEATRPTLEQLDAEELSASGVTPVTKALWFDSAAHGGLPAKLEGMTMTGNGVLILINDSDFGVDGAQTEIARVPGKR